MPTIEMKNVTKTYGKGISEAKALDSINLIIQQGEYISIMGPSGSGKSTLLNIIGCMDIPTDGEYLLEGVSLKKFSNKQLSDIRKYRISFVFQNFALLKDYSVYDNIEIPLLYRKMSIKEKRDKINYFMSRLEIEEYARKKANQLSGGQQQRVAIARALVSDADIILADEPTGALDQKMGQELLKLLSEINAMGKTVIVVTHDPKVANTARRRIEICDGKIVNDVYEREGFCRTL